MEPLNAELAARLAKAVDSMPAFPKSVQKILELTRDAGCSPKDLVQVIDKDPVITVKVLRVVNSAYFGLADPITSIDHAVVFMGFNLIKNLALGIAALGMLPGDARAGFDGQRYLMHSLTTAGFSRHLAKSLRLGDANDCFIAGLLHDFGKVVMAQFMPTEFQQALALSHEKKILLHSALQEVAGVDHALAGAMLAQKWRFADELVQTIEFQHQPERADSNMMACVWAANQISKKLDFDFGGYAFVQQCPPTIEARLGGTLDSVMDALGDVDELVQEARMFIKN